MEEEQKMQWVDKYAPKSLDEMCLSEDLKNKFSTMIRDRKVMNMTLYGIQGMGKTTLASLIIKELGDDCASLKVSCGIDNSVDMVRSKVSDFVDSYQPGKIKIAFFDEADSLSGTSSGTEGNSAQKALRSVMCTDDCVFILTCNNLGQLSNAIQSRCMPIKISFSPDDVVKRCVYILKNEGVKFSKEDFMKFYEKILKPSMPDIRSIVRNLELWSIGGVFKDTEGTKAQNDMDVMVDTIMRKVRDGVSARDISKFYIENSDSFNNNYEVLAGCIFRRLYGYPDLQTVVAEYIYRMGSVYDKEIQFYAMMLKITSMKMKLA